MPRPPPVTRLGGGGVGHRDVYDLSLSDHDDDVHLDMELTAMERAMALSQRYARFEEEQRREDERRLQAMLAYSRNDPVARRRAELQRQLEIVEIEVFDLLARGNEPGAALASEEAERIQAEMDRLGKSEADTRQQACPEALDDSITERLWDLAESQASEIVTVDDILLRSLLKQELRHAHIIPEGAVFWKEEPQDAELHRLKELVRNETIRDGLNCGLERLAERNIWVWDEEDKERARLRIAVGVALRIIVKSIVT